VEIELCISTRINRENDNSSFFCLYCVIFKHPIGDVAGALRERGERDWFFRIDAAEGGSNERKRQNIRNIVF
jgi:hypothetical protein